MPLDYMDPPPDMAGRTVYIVDFSWEPKVLLPAIKDAKEVVMIDHHKRAMDKWAEYIVHGTFDVNGVSATAMTSTTPDNLKIVYDKNYSGAGLVWKYFYPDKELPLLFQHTQDYDLWNFNMHGSREIATAIMGRGMVHQQDFAGLFQLVYYFKNNDTRGFYKLYDEGVAILKNNDVILNSILKRNTQLASLGGFVVPIANVPYEMMSRAGEILCQDYPFAALYEDWRESNTRKYSLRSKKGVGADVAVIAGMFGGNGHENAAGFFYPLDKRFPGQFIHDQKFELKMEI
jgi:oligoribonuclease NrnB/cAMP/cGMP phosphodiesterase (DHH superfamily)